MNVSDVVAQFPDTVESDWRRVGKGWAHKDAQVGEAAWVRGPVVLRRGEFNGGEFRDGEFYGGVFMGGLFYGGMFYDGEFHDGLFRGGTFRGGTFYHGDFYDGDFSGGVFYGGHFRDGAFLGGEFRGGAFFSGFYYRGIFHDTPLQLLGVLPWPVNVCGPWEVQIGHLHYTLDEWESHLPKLFRAYHLVQEDEFQEAWLQQHWQQFENCPTHVIRVPECLLASPPPTSEPDVRAVLRLCRKWFWEHPDCVTEEDGR